MINTFKEHRLAAEKMVDVVTPSLKMSLWAFLFGVITDWKALKNILIKGISINWLIVPAIILVILSFIPSVYWVFSFGLGTPFYITMFTIPETHVLLNALSGILLVRSFNKE